MQLAQGRDAFDSSGNALTTSEQEVYLGSLLTCCGRAAPSISRRLGEARASFLKLQRVWRHANITKHRKIEIYLSCVVSKLLYSLECETLRLSDRKRIDAFHYRCLRSICRIPHSMISHISNAQVLQTAGTSSLSGTLQTRQLALFGRIAALPSSSFLRSSLFSDVGITPRTLEGPRKRGRPRVTWASTQHAKALQLFEGSQLELDICFFNGQPNANKRWCYLVAGSH